MQTLIYGATTYLTSPFMWAAFVFGAIVGSFLNVCILRIPEGTFWKSQRSVCPKCQAAIPFYLNIPIFSYFILRGKTNCCHQKLSLQYPLVEFLTAVAFAGMFWVYPFITMIGEHPVIDHAELLRYLHGIVFFSILLTCSVIDLRLKIIPDVISLPMILLTPVVVYFHPDLDWKSAGIGVIAGGGILFAVAWLYWLIRKQIGMGMGDVKLLAGIGGWLGYQSIFPTVLYASVSGAVLGIFVMLISRQMNRNQEIPFGPFLAAGALLHLVFGPQLQEYLLLTR